MCRLICILLLGTHQKVSEYDQEISQTADQTMAPRGRATARPLKDNKSKAARSLFHVKMIAKLERT